LSKQTYQQLEQEISPFVPTIEQARETILDQEVSKYPIFVIHQHELEIGVRLIEKDETSLWNIHASTLEEFVTKQIVQEDKIDEFRKVYKEHPDYFCLFVINELGANFIFLTNATKPQK
jgi:hypothetical protein